MADALTSPTVSADSTEQSLPARPTRRVAAAPPPAEVDTTSVAKANEAIAIRPKRGKLTLLSRRIYNVLLYHAQQQGVDNPQYRILLSELIDDARFTSHNTELLKSHLRDMQATTIEWHTSSGGARTWTSTQLLGTVVIDEPGRGSPCSIQWTYPDAIRQRLVKPSQYTKVLLEVSARMRSYAAAVLYELGARYLTSPSRLTMREDVIWWASVLTGRSDITAVDYRILRRDTIKKALAELDALNDEFRMEAIEHKRGRKVEELQFRVVVKAQPDLRGLDQGSRNVFDLKLVERIEALGFKRPEAEDLYATTDEGAIRAALDLVESRQKSSGLAPLGSPAAYFKDALKKGYAGSVPAGEGAIPERQAIKGTTPSLAERLQRLRDDWHAERSNRARERFAEMPDEEQQRLLQRFEDEHLPELAGPIARLWRRDGMKGRVAASAFYRWLSSNLWPGEATDAQLLEFALGR